MKNCYLFLYFLFFFPSLVSAQRAFADVDFSQIDEKAKQVKGNNAEEIAKKLTEGYSTDLEKVRSIFRWMTENIAYDLPESYKPAAYDHLSANLSTNQSKRSVDEEFDERIVQYVLQKRMAVCGGYAILFKKLCSLSGIRAIIVEGYGKTNNIPYNTNSKTDHAWNLVMIDERMYLLDVCWASGYCGGKIEKFTKRLNEHYFLTPPAEFILDHYPENRRDGLITALPTLEEFSLFPELLKEQRAPSFYNLQPQRGYFECQVGDTLTFALSSPDSIQNLYVYGVTKAGRIWDHDYYPGRKKPVPFFKITGKRATIHYIMPAKSIIYVEMILNNTRILRYQIRQKP